MKSQAYRVDESIAVFPNGEADSESDSSASKTQMLSASITSADVNQLLQRAEAASSRMTRSLPWSIAKANLGSEVESA